GSQAGRRAQQAKLARDAVSALHARPQGRGDGIIDRWLQRQGLPERLSAGLAAGPRLRAGALPRTRQRQRHGGDAAAEEGLVEEGGASGGEAGPAAAVTGSPVIVVEYKTVMCKRR